MKSKNNRLTLLPVMRPTFNIREIIKQNLLLEDHLFCPKKRCRDCVNKHFLTIEALAEEAVTLECRQAHKKCPPEVRRFADDIRILHHAWSQKPKNPALCLEVAKILRQMRKELMKLYATLPLESLPHAEQARVKGVLLKALRGAKRAPQKTKKYGRKLLFTAKSVSLN